MTYKLFNYIKQIKIKSNEYSDPTHENTLLKRISLSEIVIIYQ